MANKKPKIIYLRIPVAKRLPDDEVRNVAVQHREGIRALWARKRRKLLTYLFDRDKWTMEEAKTWLKEHDETVSKKIFRGGYLVKQYGQDIDVILQPLDDYAQLGEYLDEILGDTAELGFDTGLDEMGQMTRDLPEEFIDKVREEVLSLSKMVMDSIKENLAQDIIDGVNEGLTNEQIADKVLERQNKPLTIEVPPKVDEFGNIVREGYTRTMTAKDWAQLVARTESSRIGTMAIHEAYRDSGLEKKMWLTNPGACELCVPMDGKVFPINNATASLIPYHPNSYHKDTEIYTKDGFKLVKDVKIGDPVLSLDPETRNLEWTKVTNLVSHEQDKLISFQSRNFDLEVTPDHAMLFQSRWDKKMGKVLRFEKAKDLPKESIIYRSSEWLGEKTDFQTFGMGKKDFCKFMAYWLSDGSVNRHYIHISQHTAKHIIGDELFAMNLDVKETKEGFRVKNNELADYLQQFGHAHEKYIPDEIKQLPKEYLREFLDAYVICDSHIKKAKKWKGGQFRDQKTYFTTSKKLADDLGEIILKVGRRPSYGLQKSEGVPVEHKNGVYEGNHDVWIIRECYSQHALTTSMDIKEVEYNDMVYCVELKKNHTLYVRKNGKCAWCGNCRCTWLPVIEKQISGKLHKGIKNKGKEIYFESDQIRLEPVKELPRAIRI